MASEKRERPIPVPLPCPFCGGRKFDKMHGSFLIEAHSYLPRSCIAELGEDHDLSVVDVICETGYPYIRCLCGCCGPKAKAPKKDHREAVRRAVVAWNTRASAQEAMDI